MIFGDIYFTIKDDETPLAHPCITLIITQISYSKNLLMPTKLQRREIFAKFSADYLFFQHLNRTFALIDSATLPAEQRTRAELLLYIGLWNTRNSQ